MSKQKQSTNDLSPNVVIDILLDTIASLADGFNVIQSNNPAPWRFEKSEDLEDSFCVIDDFNNFLYETEGYEDPEASAKES